MRFRRCASLCVSRNWGALAARPKCCLCRAGLGLIQAPRHSLRRWLDSGELVEILKDTPPPDMPLYVMYPPGRFLAPRIRVFIEWLNERFARPLSS
ncbi:hypothetical protein EH206_18595 [Brenneria nigrifluens DSM 30175 = ATCC 13028]|uniref:LysR substrate-binding domain-containing protein n=1 Tax=Brenneria nigrifluens DSM 30175 = ATCC 13028 TaxID=1121120 RepID=A0A2U1URJ1_9GAMM|nr:hypothetical protein DDT54_10115 [Brenneria nigrifluens DSM 30175 = ATCC 13028]QCR06002.1 hypothetical protein EH206_18595 [Brenneria nigrifluens DSM 30175 = ATCC 13028]